MPLNLPRLRRRAYDVAVGLRARWYRSFWGMHVGEGVKLSGSVRLDKTNPRGIRVGDYTALSFDVAVLTHDFVGNRHLQTRIGSHCFIGARSVVLAGVTIGDHCVVAAGSVVMTDVPPHSLVAGNPAKRAAILMSRLGRYNGTVAARPSSIRAWGPTMSPDPATAQFHRPGRSTPRKIRAFEPLSGRIPVPGFSGLESHVSVRL